MISRVAALPSFHELVAGVFDAAGHEGVHTRTSDGTFPTRAALLQEPECVMSRLPDEPDTNEPIQESEDESREPVKDEPQSDGEEAPGEPPSDLDDGPLVAANANWPEQL
ncbi:hypothetical protein GCM10007884_35440 [Methylobacterium brachythecii]|uniref:Uncharacterized protein n=2 Tax=Methylobacterium brachythecii TaxID=1176177 RepID=A0ABQ6D5C4_9HYPH|nr:hypothetical protein GCM10007884_35440 [Methylobacterium brachythecii]